MNNKNTTKKTYSRTRIAIALAASLAALWQLPDPAAQESNLAKPIEKMTPKQEELNVFAEPGPTIKPSHPLTL